MSEVEEIKKRVAYLEEQLALLTDLLGERLPDLMENPDLVEKLSVH